MEVVGPSGALVGFAILIGVLENDDLIAWFLTGIDVRVGDGGGDPEAAAFVPAHLDGAGHFGEIFFGCEAVDLETGIDLESCFFIGDGEEFVGSTGEEDVVEFGNVGVVGLGEFS